MSETKDKTEKQLICSICQKPIPAENGWSGGHNADPVNKGRCCSYCNTAVVIPARVTLIMG